MEAWKRPFAPSLPDDYKNILIVAEMSAASPEIKFCKVLYTTGIETAERARHAMEEVKEFEWQWCEHSRNIPAGSDLPVRMESAIDGHAKKSNNNGPAGQ